MTTSSQPPPEPSETPKLPSIPEGKGTGLGYGTLLIATLLLLLTAVNKGPSHKRPTPGQSNSQPDKSEREIGIQKRIAWFTGVLALVGVLQIVVLGYQVYLTVATLSITQQAANAADRSNKITQRIFEATVEGFEIAVSGDRTIMSWRATNQSAQGIAVGLTWASELVVTRIDDGAVIQADKAQSTSVERQ